MRIRVINKFLLLVMLSAPVSLWAQTLSTTQGVLDHVNLQRHELVINDQGYQFAAGMNLRSKSGLTMAPSQLRQGMIFEFVVQRDNLNPRGRIIKMQEISRLTDSKGE